MKKVVYIIVIALSVGLMGCSSAPKRAADTFMKSLKERNFANAAAACGVSKDKESQKIVMEMLIAQYGTPENSIREYKIKTDSVAPDKQHAFVSMSVVYTNSTQDTALVLPMRKMQDRWIVNIFDGQ